MVKKNNTQLTFDLRRFLVSDMSYVRYKRRCFYTSIYVYSGVDTGRGAGGHSPPPDRFRGGNSPPPLRFRGKNRSQFGKSYVFFNFKLFDYFLFNGNIIINIY